MTAPLVFASLEATSIGSFSACAAETGQSAASRSVRRASSHQSRATNAESSDAAALNLIQSSLLECLHQGVIVTSRSLKLLYRNAKAQLLCQQLAGSEKPLELPMAVVEVCQRLLREQRLSDRPLVMECQTATRQTIRLSARWLALTIDRSHGVSNPAMQSDSHAAERETQPPYILIMLENCNELLQEELRIERKKYDLTEREAEVWMLLRQEYSYQDVARLLQISLNTVKTHVKNVYAKKRSCQGREKFWCG